MDTLTSLKVFRRVVESGSFVGAADRLDLSTAMVSKHVMSVEKRIGVRLLNRNSRGLSLTEPGRVYFERCKTILDDLEETELELGALGSKPRGTLRVSCPSWFANQRVAGLLAQYRERFPEVFLDVTFEDRMVNLIEEGYDVALRVVPGAQSLPADLIARPVRSLPYFVAASREYIRRNGAPGCPAELAAHDCIAAGSMDSWVFDGPTGKIEARARIVQRLRTTAGIPHAVAAGAGLAPLPLTLFEDPAFKDILVPVLAEYPLSRTLYFAYAGRRYVPLKTRCFMDFVLESASSGLPRSVPGLQHMSRQNVRPSELAPRGAA
jgi:DNA-binding transcriptional LysR family regulator